MYDYALDFSCLFRVKFEYISTVDVDTEVLTFFTSFWDPNLEVFQFY